MSGETLDEASKRSGAGASLAEVSCTHTFRGGLLRPSPPQLALMGHHSGIERGALVLGVLGCEGASFAPAAACPLLLPRKGENTIVGARTAPPCFKAHYKVFNFLSPFCGSRSRSREVTLRMPPHEALFYSPRWSNPRPQHGFWSPDVGVFSFVPNALKGSPQEVVLKQQVLRTGDRRMQAENWQFSGLR